MAIVLKNGMGKHYQTDTQEQYVSFAKTYIPAACFYAVGIATTKLSLLAFYYRIFSATKSIILPIRILSLIVLGWMIAVVSSPKILVRPKFLLLITSP